MRATNALIGIGVVLAISVVAGHVLIAFESGRNSLLAQENLQRARSDADALRRLRGEREVRVIGRQPEAAFIAAVNRAAGDAGLPDGVARSIDRRGERQGEDGLRIQEVRFDLSPLTVPQIGGFLRAWRDNEPAWTVNGIVLRRQAGTPGERDRYGVSMVCAAEYLAENP